MKRASTLLGFCVALTVLLPATKAYAWLQFCNRTNTTTWVDYTQYDGYCENGRTAWQTRGWWRLAPNECKIIQGGSLQGENMSQWYFFHADGADGRYWSGPDLFQASRTVFSFTSCASTIPSYLEGMRKFNIGTSVNYTVNLQ